MIHGSMPTRQPDEKGPCSRYPLPSAAQTETNACDDKQNTAEQQHHWTTGVPFWVKPKAGWFVQTTGGETGFLRQCSSGSQDEMETVLLAAGEAAEGEGSGWRAIGTVQYLLRSW